MTYGKVSSFLNTTLLSRISKSNMRKTRRSKSVNPESKSTSAEIARQNVINRIDSSPQLVSALLYQIDTLKSDLDIARKELQNK